MANNTKLKKLGRRGLSFFMALVMAISLIQISAFATETLELPDVTVVDKGGETTVNGSNGESITGSKTIAVDPDGDGNDFIITLGVTTVSTSTTSMVTKAADVVLVLDVTDSMDNNGKWGKMKTAANGFIEKLLPAGNTTNRVAIVIYAGKGYTTLCNWTQNAATAKNTYKNASNSDALRKQIEKGKNGTNCQAGFLGADVQLDSATAELQYAVYLTDGAANVYYTDSVSTTRTLTCGKTEGKWYGSIMFGGYHYHDDGCYTTTITGYKALTAAEAASSGISGTSDNQAPSTTCAILQAELLKTNHASAKLIGVGIGTGTNNAVLSTTQNKALNASYSTNATMDLDKILEDISQSITDATESSGSVVTDPMGSHISLGEVVDSDDKATGEVTVEGGSTLKWDVSKAKPVSSTTSEADEDGKKTTTNYYELKYHISVTRNAAFYDYIKENGTLPTNGDTTMPYKLGSTEDTLKFMVPEVTSVMPTVGYTVNYYKQKPDGAYDRTYITDTGDYGTTFAGEAQDYGKNYEFNASKSTFATETASKTIGLNSEANVIDLYYALKTTTITVEHKLQTKTYDQTGNVTYPESPLAASATVTAYLGTSFNASKYIKTPTASDGWKYDAALMTEKEQSLTIDPVTGAATITIWYTDELDRRLDVNLDVTHHYETHNWVYNDATKTWGEEIMDSTDPVVDQITGKYGTKASATVKKDYAKYLDHTVIDGIETDDRGLSVNLTKVSGHKIDLYYVIPATNKPATASYQIVHHYNLTTVTDTGSEVNSYTNSEDVQTVHAGDVITYNPATDAQTNYNNVEYTLKTTNSFNITMEADKTKTIDIYYEKDATTQVDVTVNYAYEVYQQVIDPETGKKSYEPASTPPADKEVFHKLAGNLFTLTPNSAKTDGYEEVSYDKAENVKLVAGETYDYTITCKHYENIDPETEGDVTIVHNYYTLTTYYNAAGELQVDERTADGSTSKQYYGVIDDKFSEDLVFAYGGNSDYELAAGDTTANSVEATISGKDGVVTVNYYRSVDKREGTETTVTVTPVLVTRTKTANADGTFAYTDTPVTGTPVAYPTAEGGKLYAGQKWSVTPESSIVTADGKFDFNAQLTTDKYENVILGDKENPTAITLCYLREVEDLTPVTVIVRHYRIVNEYDVDTGKKIPGTPVKDTTDDVLPGYYVNNVFSTKNTSKTMGYDILTAPEASYAISADNIQTVMLDGKETKVLYVDWTYTKDHYPMKANVIVNYKASLVEYSTKEVLATMEFDGSDVPFNLYVGEQFTASDRYLTFTSDDITKVTLDDEDAGKNRTFRVSEGGNVITVEFVMYQDSRQDASVLVKHDYFDLDTYTSVETKNADLSHETLVETERNDKGLITNGIYVGAEFTAVPDSDTGDYHCRTDASKLTFELERSESAVTVEYVKTSSSDPGDATYAVRHEYHVNGQLEDSVDGVGGTGKIGATIDGNTDVTPVTDYNGYTYEFTSGTSVVLSKDDANQIIMSYNRTRAIRDDDDDDDDDDDKKPVPPVVIEDPTTPTTELPDVEVPTVEQPVTELEEPVVPMAEAPKTGDSLVAWVLAAAASGIGLVYLALSGKKRKEDAQ